MSEQEILQTLVDDVTLSLESLSTSDRNAFWRRSSIRATFSLIEAWAFMARQETLKSHEEGGIRLALGDEVLLREETYHVKGNGALKTSRKSGKFIEMLMVTCRCVFATHHMPYDLDHGSAGWQSLMALIEVRNRLTHPKRSGDLVVTDAEMEHMRAAFLWFGKNVIERLMTGHAN